MNDSTVLSRIIELEAEQLMCALSPLEVNEGLACHINSYHHAKMVDHAILEELTKKEEKEKKKKEKRNSPKRLLM